jgi:hypothetical protein
MGQSEDDIETARKLLDGLTTDEVRAMAVEALRVWRRTTPGPKIEFYMHGGLGLALAPILAARRGIQVDANNLKEPFLYQQNEPWMQTIVDFTAWLVSAGLATPLHHKHDPRMAGYTTAYRLTEAGVRLLEGDDDHPVLPGFVERVVARCSSLPGEVSVHLVDARACLDHGLLRPAVSLLGLAYEAAEDAAIDYLGKAGKLRVPSGANAAKKISAVKAAIPTLISDLEQRGAAAAAWDFADQLRARRNHASHPNAWPDFSDPTEVHEFIVSAGRHLPGLWSVRV